MVESSHVCIRRPCLICALEHGDPLPPNTRLVTPKYSNVLPWPEERRPTMSPRARRVAEKLEHLDLSLICLVERYVDTLFEPE